MLAACPNHAVHSLTANEEQEFRHPTHGVRSGELPALINVDLDDFGAPGEALWPAVL